MFSRHAVALWSHASLLVFLVEAGIWKLQNLTDYTRYVVIVTVGAGAGLSRAALVLLPMVQVGATMAFFKLRDGRPAAAVLVASQLAEYVLLREVNAYVTVAILLSCLRVTEQLDRINQSVSASPWVRIDQKLREKATAYCIAPFLLVGVALEALGVLLRLGDDGYRAALAHDRTAASLGICTLCLYLASFDEKPDKHADIAWEALARFCEDRGPRVRACVSRTRARIVLAWTAVTRRLVNLWPRRGRKRTLDRKNL